MEPTIESAFAARHRRCADTDRLPYGSPRHTVYLLVAGAMLWAMLHPGSARADILMENPDWKIAISDYGYGDLLLFENRVFPPGFLPEMLSGEWAAAIGYDGMESSPGIPLPEAAMWLTPEFFYPDWTTNSTFTVSTPATIVDSDLDGLPEASWTVAVDSIEVHITCDMEDTVTGAAMSVGPGPPPFSNRYVMIVTYEIENVGAVDLTNVRLYQFMHAHPVNSEIPNVTASYDSTLHGGALPGFRYDFTQTAVSTGAPDGSSTGFMIRDHVTLSSDSAPDGWSLGHYRGHDFVKPADDDVEPDGDGDGVHFEVERDTLEGEVLYGPDEVGSAARWSTPVLQPGFANRFEVSVMLSVRSEEVVEPVPGLGPVGACLLAGLIAGLGAIGSRDRRARQ